MHIHYGCCLLYVRFGLLYPGFWISSQSGPQSTVKLTLIDWL
uniref:CESA2 n=1 Tax=Arundo donax TaxID=35708 RepID=A0A0A9EHR3_ARUDO